MTDNEEAVDEEAVDEDPVDDGRSRRDGPVATLLGATVGPLGAAFASVVDENRIAVRFAFGSGVDLDDGSFDRGTTIEVEDAEGSGDEADDGPRSGIEAAGESEPESAESADSD